MVRPDVRLTIVCVQVQRFPKTVQPMDALPRLLRVGATPVATQVLVPAHRPSADFEQASTKRRAVLARQVHRA